MADMMGRSGGLVHPRRDDLDQLLHEVASDVEASTSFTSAQRRAGWYVVDTTATICYCGAVPFSCGCRSSPRLLTRNTVYIR
jgi:hypothetical protein